MTSIRSNDKLSIYFSDSKGGTSVIERLNSLSIARDRSVSYLVVEAILQYLDREDGDGTTEPAQSTMPRTQGVLDESSPAPQDGARLPRGTGTEPDPESEMALSSIAATNADLAAPTMDDEVLDPAWCGEPRTLSEWEEHLSRRMLHVRLLFEIGLEEKEFEHLLSCFAMQLNERNLEHRLSRLVAAFPRAYACLLVFSGLHEYSAGGYWPRVLGLLNLPVGASIEQLMGRAYESVLSRLGLEAGFEGTRFVGKILGHAGIPISVLPDVFEKLIAPYCHLDLPPTQLILAWTRDGRLSTVSKTVERFLRFGGQVATEYIGWLEEAYRDIVVRGEEPDKLRNGIPSAIVAALQRWRGHQHQENSAHAPRGRRTAVWRGSTRAQIARTSPRSVLPTRRHRIVCYEHGGRWGLAVRISGSHRPAMVEQMGSHLDCIDNRMYALVDSQAAIRITTQVGEYWYRLPISSQQVSVFRTGRDWMGMGFRCRHVTRGYYVVFAPASWTRDETVSGRASVAPEPTSIEGMRAHFFWIDDPLSHAIAFRTDRATIARASSMSMCTLEGDVYSDPENPNLPTFTGAFPAIRLCKGIGWSDIADVVAWSHTGDKPLHFPPDGADFYGEDRCVLPIEASGEYHIKLVGVSNAPLACVDVRLLAEIAAISAGRSRLFPSEAGHDQATIRILVSPEVCIDPAEQKDGIEISRDEGRIDFKLGAAPECDGLSLGFSTSGYVTRLSIGVARLWWSVCDAALPIEETLWQDRTLPLTRDDFRPSNKREIRFRLPAAERPRIHGVGFGWDAVRSVVRMCEQGYYSVLLSSFFDDSRLTANSEGSQLSLYGWDENELVEVALACVSVEYQCSICNALVAQHEKEEHAKTHAFDVVPEVQYAEIVERHALDLPKRILKCAYCASYYVPVPEGTNPDGKMRMHIDEECPAVPTNGEPRTYSYSVVSDAAEVRAHVYKNLPVLRRCSLCRQEFDGNMHEDIIAHVLREHLSEIIRPS